MIRGERMTPRPSPDAAGRRPMKRTGRPSRGQPAGLAASLWEADLARNLGYTSISNPQPRKHPLWIGITHFFSHQVHHRGQLTTLLFQRGIDPGATDLIWLPELRERWKA